MADHRVTDLSYGHLGKAFYDIEENEWNFSVNLDNRPSIQQILPFKEWLPPSIRAIPQNDEKPSLALRSQRKWLLKALPEAVAADTLASELSKVDLSQNDIPIHIGPLLAVGRAADTDRVSGSRTTQILAVPYGDAGHILRLIRPRRGTRGWGKKSAARVSLLDPESPEYGHWVGEAGVIRQIVVSDTENGSGTWLAVRQDTATTIFRPQYGRLHNASTTIGGFLERFPVSQLNPNAVATLTVEQSQSTAHVDVAFNPWYTRQFAVIDITGIWSIWDIDVGHNKNARHILVAGKRGSIYDDFTPDPLQKPLNLGHSDGWYKIMWICNISTVIVCNRRHIALIDLSAGTSQVLGREVIPPNSQDWILDIKRSATSNKHIFVLTTSRIFWLEITATIKVVLSYRHFRNADDEKMKLVVLKDHTISVLITSTSSPLIQSYCFSETMNPLEIPSSCHGSFSFRYSEDEQHVENGYSHISFAPCLLSTGSSNASGVGQEYADNDIRFFQVWALDIHLGLVSTLCGIYNEQRPASARKLLSIQPPTIKVRQSRRRFGARVVEESFIVPDGEVDEDEMDHVQANTVQDDMQAMLLDEWQDDLKFRINWRRVYRHVFGLDSVEKPVRAAIPTLEGLLGRVSDQIHHGLEENELATRTFTETSGLDTISEDLEHATTVLRDFLESLEPDPTAETISKVTVSNLVKSAESRGLEAPKYPDLSDVYDQMDEYWMASMPSNLSNFTRVARYRVIRQLAIDVCLSSIGISIENRLVSAENPLRELEDDAMSLPTFDKDSRVSRESSPTNLFSSQLAAISEREPNFRFPTPAKTPSIYSHATSASEVKEDPAITRLRQYAVTIKSKPDMGPPSLLSHWPATPGADPANYSYEDAQKASIAAESGDESEHRNRKEEARRRRRTERFLRQERSRVVETAASQSIFIPSGSQPAALPNHAASSQSVADLPMTQPVLGTFGSRIATKGKKKVKKARTAGFR